jgi:hypothetical protein
MDLKGIGCEGVDWNHLAQDEVNMVTNLWIPLKSWEFLDTE